MYCLMEINEWMNELIIMIIVYFCRICQINMNEWMNEWMIEWMNKWKAQMVMKLKIAYIEMQSCILQKDVSMVSVGLEPAVCYFHTV